MTIVTVPVTATDHSSDRPDARGHSGLWPVAIVPICSSASITIV
jgi:hypothetical protein